MTFSPRLIYFYNWKKFESSNFEEFSKNRRIHGKRNELRSSSFSLINTTLERAAFDRVQSFVDHTFQRTPCKEWSYNMVVWTTHVEGRNSLSATRRRDTIEMGGGGGIVAQHGLRFCGIAKYVFPRRLTRYALVERSSISSRWWLSFMVNSGSSAFEYSLDRGVGVGVVLHACTSIPSV